MEVAGNKVISFEAKAGKKGYIKDQWGNKIYPLTSKVNQERLAPKKKTEKKESVVSKKKAVKRIK